MTSVSATPRTASQATLHAAGVEKDEGALRTPSIQSKNETGWNSGDVDTAEEDADVEDYPEGGLRAWLVVASVRVQHFC
jgi:hypothetical protein